MESLNINTFTGSAKDRELSEYKVLAALKNYSGQLHKNLLYPAFGELVELFHTLNSLIGKRDNFIKMKKRITGIDLQKKSFIYEKDNFEIDADNLSNVFEFIMWAMPKISEVFNEGAAIFDFVESQISIKEIGLVPFYKDEGYFLVPDHKRNEINVFRFQISSIINSDIPFKSLKSFFIESIPNGSEAVLPETIKLELINKFPDLPNPAAYNVCTELEMPFEETILPIAKRKMMRQLAA